jgi:hypothetical protein
MTDTKNTSTAPAGIDLDSPLIAALKSARELLVNLDGLSKNNICNLAAEEVEQIDAALARRAAEAAPAEKAVATLKSYWNGGWWTGVTSDDRRLIDEAFATLAQQSSHSTAAVVAGKGNQL